MSQLTFTRARHRLNEWRFKVAVAVAAAVAGLFFAGTNADYALSLARERLWERHEAMIQGLSQQCLVTTSAWIGARTVRTFPGDCAPIRTVLGEDYPERDYDLVTRELVTLSVPDVAGRTWEIEARGFAGLPPTVGARLPVLLDPADAGRIWHLPNLDERDGFARSMGTAPLLFLASLLAASAVLFFGFRNPDREP